MLAKDADILFLVDKSASAGMEFSWIADFVTRSGGLDDYLTDHERGITPRYGLIGFGDGNFSPEGHSHVLDGNDSNSDGDKLFGNAAQLASVVSELSNQGSNEQVWDAIEHTIAEYEFRDGAAVIFIIFRRDDLQGNDSFAGNEPRSIFANHTFTGTLATLKSYNVTLNAVVEAMFDPAMGEFVLGVEAEHTDRPAAGYHVAHVYEPLANQPTPPDVLLASYNGSISGTYLESGKSIRISTSATAQIAGPSAADYRAEATTYAFEDISSTGAAIGNDIVTNGSKELTSANFGSFTFPFYGEARTSLIVNSDGSITFDDPSYIVEDWVAEEPSQARVAPLWADYDRWFEPFEVYWQIKDAGQSTERLIVQWDEVNYLYDSGAGSSETVTFQAALYEDGRIVFSYQDLDVSDSFFTDGASATVGVGTDEFLYAKTIPAGFFVDGLHDFDALPGAEDDFIRLAWATGGVAWNNDTISGASSSTSAYVEAFDTAFIQSIGRQILDKHERGDVAFADVPVVQVNMGGPALGDFISDTNTTILGSSFFPSGTTTPSTTETIARNGNSMAGDSDTLNVFKTARSIDVGGLSLSFPASLVPAGRYVVELMFASFGGSPTANTVRFEDYEEQFLNYYIVEYDAAKIPTGTAEAPEYELFPELLGDHVPIVKRYAVDVIDDNGLQVLISGFDAMLNGIRVLSTPAPRVTNVVIKGSEWAPGVEYSFASLVGAGMQLRPIPTQGADTIEIHFDGPVAMDGSELTLNRTIRNSNGSVDTDPVEALDFSYDPLNYIATWTYPIVAPDPEDPDHRLLDGKYAIHLSDAVTGGGLRLDGDWTNPSTTLDDWHDDGERAFIVGDSTPGSEGGVFRLHFAILVADFNGDGLVGGEDQLLWQELYGETSLWADANGDGVVDDDDFDIWDEIPLAILPMRRFGSADVNDDDVVNSIDYYQWAAGWGETGDGDIDGDGDTDGWDFLLWQSAFGQYSAWYVGDPPAPELLVGIAAPQVLNVVISGSQSTHAPFSFDTVDGSGLQLRTVPVGGADTVSIVFSEAVNVSAESLALIGLRIINRPVLAEFHYDPLTYTATWRYEGWSVANQYLISLSDMITDVEGNRLDGEWVNPLTTATTNAAVSEFPSGDGDPGGMFNFVITLLAGDADLDGVVTSADLDILIANYGQLDRLFAHGDFTGDGLVTNSDISKVIAYWGWDFTAIGVLADFDGDQDVDEDDLQVIFDNANMTGAVWADGDLNGDGTVDADDLDLALAQFGLGGLFINAVA